jgi:hypothetical protein
MPPHPDKMLGLGIGFGVLMALIFTLIFLMIEQGVTDFYSWRRRKLVIDQPLPKLPKPERISPVDVFRWVRAGMPMKSKPVDREPVFPELLDDRIPRPRIGTDRRPRVGE